jgi:histidinol-phosphatase
VSPHELRDLLDFAVEVAWRAGRATLAHYQTGVAAHTKPDDSPVTAADTAAEAVARDLIERRFPGDGILGEEQGGTRLDEARRRWVIDPIDGTRSFMRGVPLFGVMIALQEDADVVLGVLHFPALDETVYAARGLGCWWNGRRALVSDVDSLDRALILTTDAENIGHYQDAAGWERLRARAGLVRTWGDCYGYALLATGRAEAMLDPIVSPWDVAALVPIVEEAGGVLSAWADNAAPSNSVIATNAALSNVVRRLVRGES